MSAEVKKRGRKIRTMDLSALADANFYSNQVEEEAEPFFLTCALCKSGKNIAKFKNKHICMKCIELIRRRN